MTDETPPAPTEPAVFGLAIAPDGVPYIVPGSAAETQIHASSPTTYYITK